MESRDEAAPFHRTWKTPPKPPPAFPTSPTAPATRKRRSRGDQNQNPLRQECYLCPRTYVLPMFQVVQAKPDEGGARCKEAWEAGARLGAAANHASHSRFSGR